MSAEQIKKCPLCMQELSCRVNDITHCDCNKIVLTKAAALFLERSGLDCLCNNCLEKLNKVSEEN